MTTKKTKVTQALDVKSELDIVLNRLHAEVDFAAKNFNSNSGHFATDLNQAMREMNQSMQAYEAMLCKQDRQIKDLEKQLSTLALVPDKIQQRVSLLIPQIVKKVEKVQIAVMEKQQLRQEDRIKDIMNSCFAKLDLSHNNQLTPTINIENEEGQTVAKKCLPIKNAASNTKARQGSSNAGSFNSIVIILAGFMTTIGGGYLLLQLL